jgi:phosphoglycerate dehydrogenase-like enzyme
LYDNLSGLGQGGFPDFLLCNGFGCTRLGAGGSSHEQAEKTFLKRKLKIGITGASNIGGALSRHFTRLGHDVVVANSRGPERLAGLARPVSVLTFDAFP